MNLSVGIVGLPNVGKSTLFNALMRRQLAKVADYPFTTIEPHEGTIDIPDDRLTKLSDMIKPEKTTHATITFIDIAGLIKGAHKGEGLGNEFLAHIKGIDAILQVVRAFESSQAIHPLGTIDPERDIEITRTELILKDLETLTKLLDKEKVMKDKNLLSRLKDTLNSGKLLSVLDLSSEEEIFVKNLNLLSTKPTFYVLNLSEEKLQPESIKKLEDKNFLVVCAKLEMELNSLSPSEQQEYLQSLGIRDSGLTKIVKKSYEILDLITFFTIKGGKEVRATPIKKGTTAPFAGGEIHSDFEKKFIKAEKISFAELVKFGSWHKAHEQGKIELVGHDYVVNEGDILEFKIGA